ncbi:MAG TPA: protein arginine kinase [Clostridiales bacterium]|nr:protein arginine kinase [Clostridiales bacterium]
MIKWIDDSGTEKDIVVSSRIRYARNLKNHKFPIILDKKESEEIFKEISDVVKSKDIYGKNFSHFKTSDIPPLEKNMLIERHIISPALIENQGMSGFIMSNDEKISIMINEEDHLRLQVLSSGLNLMECLEKADEIDSILDEKLEYAYHKQFGYITACPTNLGTGLRASSMLHLPALVMTGRLEKLLNTISKFGISVRGVYGEGSKSIGYLFQISNQTTLGNDEKTIVEKIEKIAIQIVNKEREAREYLLNENRLELDDRVHRAYGIVTNCTKITTDEAVKLLSLVKLGVDTGLLEKYKDINFNKLFVEIQPMNIQFEAREELNEIERDTKRAEIIKTAFNKESE